MNIQSNINSAMSSATMITQMYSIAKQKKAAEQASQARQAKLEMQAKTRTELQKKRLENQVKRLDLEEKKLSLKKDQLSLRESEMVKKATAKHERELKASEIRLADGTPISALGPSAQAQILAQLGGQKNGK